MAKINYQNYPCINDDSHPYNGYLNESVLKKHSKTITKEKLKAIIKESIEYAAKKSS